MIPKKARDVNAEYARSIGIPAEHVEVMSQALFQTIKDAMGTYDHNNVYVQGLGIFFFRVWKIEDEVRKCNNILRQAILPVSVLESIQEKRQNLIKMDAIILKELNRREDKKSAWKANPENIHNRFMYIKKKCKCDICRLDFNSRIRQDRVAKKARIQREEYRQQKQQQHESERKAAKGMGEQDQDS